MRTRRWWGFFSYTFYWSTRDGEPPSESVRRLGEALDLADELDR